MPPLDRRNDEVPRKRKCESKDSGTIFYLKRPNDAVFNGHKNKQEDYFLSCYGILLKFLFDETQEPYIGNLCSQSVNQAARKQLEQKVMERDVVEQLAGIVYCGQYVTSCRIRDGAKQDDQGSHVVTTRKYGKVDVIKPHLREVYQKTGYDLTQYNAIIKDRNDVEHRVEIYVTDIARDGVITGIIDQIVFPDSKRPVFGLQVRSSFTSQDETAKK